MSTLSETNILAGVLNSARQLSLFYLKQADGLDKTKTFTVDGFTTNSILWLVCHLVWAEDFLVLQGLGTNRMNIPWLEHFRLGAEYPDASVLPPYEEAFDVLHNVHTEVMSLLHTFPDEALNETNNVGLKFGAGDSKRILRFCIGQYFF